MEVPLRRHLQRLKKRDLETHHIQIGVTGPEWEILDEFCKEHGVTAKTDLARLALEHYIGKRIFRPRTAVGGHHTREECRRQNES